MKKLVLLCATLIGINAAAAQPYTGVPNFSYDATPNFVPQAPPTGGAYGGGGGAYSGGAYGGVTGGYGVAPGSGYNWREQRGDADWRNNTWREERFDTDWRNNNWQTRRELRDWRERDDYAKTRNPDAATDEGLVQCGKGSVGSAGPCAGSTYQIIPTQKSQGAQTPNAASTPTTPTTPGTGGQGGGESDRASASASASGRPNTSPRGVADCGHGAMWRRCQ